MRVFGDNKGTVGDKHSGGLSLVKHLVTSRHIVSFLRDNLVTSCKLLRDTGNKQAHCMHIVRFIYFGNKKAIG